MNALTGFGQLLRRLAAALLTPTSYYIGGHEALPSPLTAEEELRLLSEHSIEDADVRRTLIERNLRLVIYIARKFENTGVGLEDLISIGSIGLIKSVNTYKPERKIKLATYASRCIENEILMFLRKTSGKRCEVSIDEPLGGDSDGNELLLSDILGTEPDEVSRPVEDAVDRTLLRQALTGLSNREHTIIAMRYGLDGQQDRTQKEVAEQLGISQSYISRLEKRILLRLKCEIMANYR